MSEQFDLGQRMDDLFPEIENEIVTNLRKNNEEYAALRAQLVVLKTKHPAVSRLLDCYADARLADDDYPILIQVIKLRNKLEDIERQQLYFRGHADAIAYLKKVGAI